MKNVLQLGRKHSHRSRLRVSTLVSGLFLTLTFCLTQPLAAQIIKGVGGDGANQAVKSTGSQGNQYMMGATLMFMSNEATQNGENLPGGTSIFSQLNMQYNLVNYLTAFGLIYQQDKIGVSQVNQGIALKAELTWKGYYAEIGYGTAQQTFTNRAVQSRSGTQNLYGFGIRVPFLHDLFYFDGGVRKRTTVYTKQDGVSMRRPLTETLFVPFIGMGISL